MTRILWMPAALRDVVAHTGYITNYNPRAADQLAVDLDEAANSLAIFPMRGRPGLVSGTVPRNDKGFQIEPWPF